ncbi:MAG: hypothetical protein ABJA70_20255 [Chryseolinea sp.]
MIYKFAIVIHLLGLILLAGSTLFSFIGFQKIIKHASGESLLVGITMSIAKIGFGIGIACLILSGVTMIVLANGYASQLWFKLKLGVVILIVVNNLGVGRPAMAKLVNYSKDIDRRVGLKFRWFYSLQCLLMIVIIVLSVFRFV